jgi:cytochrome c oxidase subunit I+III
VPRTILFSLALFASSGTLVLAERRLAREDQRGFVLSLVATVVLALVFLLGQVTEYAHLYGEGITIGTNLFTSSFFTLTGFHSVHVTVGMLLLALFALLGARGHFRGHRRRAAVDALSVYWHFVDAVWVVLLSVVYLWNLVS